MLLRHLPSAPVLVRILSLSVAGMCGVFGASSVFGQASLEGSMKRFQPVTLTFPGPSRSEEASTFLDHRFHLKVITPSGKQLRVPGFFAADGEAATTSASAGDRWRVRILPLETGTYAYAASFRCGNEIAVSLDENAGTACAFDGERGRFSIARAEASAPGHYARGLLRQEGPLMRFTNGELFIKGGSDSPENFFAYAGFDGTPGGRSYEHDADWQQGDPTWQEEKGKDIIGALNYLASEGINAFSLLTMNVNGDGNDVYPWPRRSDRYTYDVSKLAQWEIVFSHADRLGLFIHFKTQETENDQLLDGGTLGTERKLYYRELVARFGHHHALNWNLGEENTNTDAERAAFAQHFEALDPYDHPVVVHTYPKGHDYENVYGPLLGLKAFDGVSLQLNEMNEGAVWNQAQQWLSRSADTGEPWVCSVDEPGTAADGVYEGEGGPNGGNLLEARAVMYAAYLAGCYGTEWYFGYRRPHNDLNLTDFRSRDTWFGQVNIAVTALRTFYAEVERPGELASSQVEGGYALQGQVGDGEARALVYLSEGTSSFGTSYERVTYIDPRTGEALEEPISGGLAAPFSGDAVAVLAGDASGSPRLSVTGFTLVNADTNEDVGPLSGGHTLGLAQMAAQNLSVRAHTEGTVESVVFALSGKQQQNWTDDLRPYLLKANGGGDSDAWTPAAGRYTLEAVPFSEDGGRGTEGAVLAVSFTVTADSIPVALTSFEASTAGDDVALRWRTASESSNAGFEVQQRSEGAEEWIVAGFVEGAGTTSAPQDYAYRVDGLPPGRYVFRLRQVDYDGTETYHGEIEAVVRARSFTLRPVAPNPFQHEALLRFAIDEPQPVRLELFNALGRRIRVLYQGTVPAHEEQTVPLQAHGLASGLYLVRLTGAQQSKTQTVVLVK